MRLEISPTSTARTFWLAAMLFCSQAAKRTVETGPDPSAPYPKKYRIQEIPLWRADSNVSRFAGRIHRMRVDERHIQKEKYRIQKYPDTCEGASE